MPDRDLPRITNIWSRIAGTAEGGQETQVIIEADRAFPHRLENSIPGVLLVHAQARAVMPEGTIPIRDGLLKQVTLRQCDAGTAQIVLERERYGPYRVSTCDTLPARLILHLDRAPLKAVLAGRRVVLDPGHGGRDRGYRGPVNLWEKDVVLITAEKLAALLTGAGAGVWPTRTDDVEADPFTRLVTARKVQADLFVSLHTGHAPTARTGGNRVLYNPASPASITLARLVREALQEQVSLKSKPMRPDTVYLVRLGDIPGITVEIVTISNWVEEGLLRMPRFHEKTAFGIFNGILRWLVKENDPG